MKLLELFLIYSALKVLAIIVLKLVEISRKYSVYETIKDFGFFYGLKCIKFRCIFNLIGNGGIFNFKK